MSGIHAKYLLAVPVLILLYFYGLTRVGLLGPDEPRYAAIGREMATSGDFITPRLFGEPWFEKPALLYWLIGLGYRSGLPGEAAVRLPVALVSTGFLLLFFRRLRREFGEKAALYSTLVLASSAGWLVYSHVAVTDVPLAAAFGGAILLFLPWIRSGGRRGLVIGGLLLGLAVLAKGLVPLVLAFPVVVIAAVRRRWVDLLIMTAAWMAVAAPWYLACWLINGQVFVDEFIWKHHISRFISPALQHVQPWWFYIPVLVGLLFPWSPTVALLFRKEQYSDDRKKFLAAVSVLGFVFFSASTNKLPGYLLPILPVLAALIGIRLSEAVCRPAVFAISGGLLAALPVVAAVLPDAVAYGSSRAQISWAAEINFFVLILLVVAGVCWWAERRGQRQLAMGLIFGTTVASVVALKTFTFPRLDEAASARRLWFTLKAKSASPCVENSLRRGIREGLNYYAGYQLPSCDGRFGDNGQAK